MKFITISISEDHTYNTYKLKHKACAYAENNEGPKTNNILPSTAGTGSTAGAVTTGSG